jgi:hypothetical protein
MQANDFLEAKNDLTMRFIPLEGYGRVYTEAAVIELLAEYAINEMDEIKDALDKHCIAVNSSDVIHRVKFALKQLDNKTNKIANARLGLDDELCLLPENAAQQVVAADRLPVG